ncbi:hypothetical protein SCA6_007947 [Theobroma cacao]
MAVVMEGNWTKSVICMLLVLASGSPLWRLPGAEARGPFCCPRMVDCNKVCQGFPNRCVDCKCICGEGDTHSHSHSHTPPLPMASAELIN